MHKILENVDVTDLPSLPHVLVDVLEACQSVDVTFQQLAGFVETDAALTAKLLKLLGSSRQGARDRLDSIPRMLQSLGRRAVETVALQGATESAVAPDWSFQLTHWRRALQTAIAARQIARSTGHAHPDEAYLAGLLHNLGELLFMQAAPQRYADLWRSTQDEVQRTMLEQEQFGITHAELAAQMIESWSLNCPIADAVRYHHQPDDYLLDAHPAVRMVQFAARLGRPDASNEPGLIESARRLFDMDAAQVTTLLEATSQRMARVEEMLQLTEMEAPTPPQSTGPWTALGRQVRERALLASLASGDPGGVRAIEQAARLIVGATGSLTFRLDPSGAALIPDPESCRDSVLGELRIRPDGRSLVARALREGLCHAFDPDSPVTSVGDRQIQDHLRSDGLVCIAADGTAPAVSVIALGVRRSTWGTVSKQLGLLERFVKIATRGLSVDHREPAGDRANAGGSDAEGAPGEPAPRIRKIVHEVNNPLSIIRNYLQVLSLKLGADHPAREELGIIEEELQRTSGLIRQLTQTDPESSAPAEAERVQINGLVANLMRVAQAALPGDGSVRVELDLDPDLPDIRSRADAIKQIILNLVRNAAEALQHGGTIAIKTRYQPAADGNRRVALEIHDDGPGIAPAVRDRLFQPVESDKPGHAGLGLSIVRQLVLDIGGRIECQSDQRVGTRFRIDLPVDQEPPSGPADETRIARTTGHDNQIPEGERR